MKRWAGDICVVFSGWLWYAFAKCMNRKNNLHARRDYYRIMKILYGLIYEMDASMEFMYVFLPCSLIVLAVLHHFLKEHLKIWAALCTIPFITYILFLIRNRYIGNTELTIQRYSVFGIVSLLILLWGVDVAFKHSYKACSIVVILSSMVLLLSNIVIIWAVYLRPNVANYSGLGWTESFEKTMDYLEKEYILNEWKEIDYAQIRAELVPKVREAEKNQDEIAFVEALYELKYAFHDGHVTVRGNMAGRNAAMAKMAGNDYGFSMFRANTGEVVAVLVGDGTQCGEWGIHNGTVITKWEGVPIDDACKEVKCIDRVHAFQTVENIHVGQPIFLAGQGGEELSVSFINDDGKEETAVLYPCGEYIQRRTRALEILFGDNVISRDNYSVSMLDGNIGYVRIWEEEYSQNPFFITGCTIKGFSQTIYDELDEALEKLKRQNMDRIILDIRNNEGGNGFEARTVASLFTSKAVPYYLTLYKNGEFKVVSESKPVNSGKWSDMPVVVLVNGQTVSAGEEIANYLKGSENVVLMGNTTTWGAVQGTGGSTVLSGSKYEFRFPISPVVGGDGLPIVDLKSDAHSRLAPDVMLEYGIDAVVDFFENSQRDMVLEEAIAYIQQVDVADH